MDVFGADIMGDVLVIFQDISPKFSGVTAFQGTVAYLVNDGFEVSLLEDITPHGVKLNRGQGGWANKRNRRTGALLKGWFSVISKNAGIDYLRGKGGYFNSINATRESLVKEAQDNPLRQRIYTEQIAESGDADVNID